MMCANSFVLGVRRRGEENDEEPQPEPETEPESVPESVPEIELIPIVEAIPEPAVEQQPNGVCFEPIDEKTLFEHAPSPCSQTISETSEPAINGHSVDPIVEIPQCVRDAQPCKIEQRPQPYVNYKPVPNGVKYTEGDVTDEIIAEIMSGEAEVLKEHNILG